MTISRSIKAGMLYFTGVFAVGFAFGAIRMIALVPAVGETWAVVIESPFILGMSWLLCVRAIVRLQVSASLRERILMGGVALGSLLLAEYVLWIGMFGESTAGFFQRYATLAGIYGFFGQIAYGLFPLLQIRVGSGDKLAKE